MVASKHTTPKNRKCSLKNAFLLLSSALASELLYDDEYEQVKQKNLIRRLSHAWYKSSKKRIFRQRRRWDEFKSKLTKRQFRRYFRMEVECFDDLAKKIENIIGEKKFKSELYLDKMRSGMVRDNNSSMDYCHRKSTGGFIPGELKLALTLRMLAGGSYMDLALLFETSFSTSYEIFHYVINEWINNEELVKINGFDYLNDDVRMKSVAYEFSKKSNGIFNGVIGAIDGWLVRIKRPSCRRDKVRNPGSFFSRKGFYAINVQVVVDRKKKVLYRSILSRGAEHDSSAFKMSSLHETLKSRWKDLRRKGFYLLGDSAYALRSFLLTPFDNSLHGTDADNYNFYHSSSRIVIECAFGEIDMRWGIFWRPLNFTLHHSTQVIDACFRLHNFIIDYREKNNKPTAFDRLEESIFNDEYERFLVTRNCTDGFGIDLADDEQILDDNGETIRNMVGRPRKDETESRQAGVEIRNDICERIKQLKLSRPKSNYYRHNNRTHEA
jgi:hypothetical protein